MIKSQTGVTTITLTLAGVALTLIQTGTGSLKHGDDSSATNVLVAARDALTGRINEISNMVNHADRLTSVLSRIPSSAALLNEGRGHINEAKAKLGELNQNLAEVEQLLVYAKQYDTEQNIRSQTSETFGESEGKDVELEELIDAVIGKMFGNPSAKGDQIFTGCGQEGCPGCGGGIASEIDLASLFQGVRKQSEGIRATDGAEDILSAMRQQPRSGIRGTDIPSGLPESLRKALESGKVRILSLGDINAQSGGLSDVLGQLFNTRAGK